MKIIKIDETPLKKKLLVLQTYRETYSILRINLTDIFYRLL